MQIGDENVHRVRAVMDEVFGEGNFVSSDNGSRRRPEREARLLARMFWLRLKIMFCGTRRELKASNIASHIDGKMMLRPDMTTFATIGLTYPASSNRGGAVCSLDNLTSQTGAETTRIPVVFFGREFSPTAGGWKTNQTGVTRLKLRTGSVSRAAHFVMCAWLKTSLSGPFNNLWDDISQGGFVSAEKIYVVQTTAEIVQRCISWPPIPATSCLTRPAAPARRPMSRSNGAAAGSPSTPRAWRSRWPAPASWARAIRITSSPIPAKASIKEAEVTAHRAEFAADARQHPPRLRL